MTPRTSPPAAQSFSLDQLAALTDISKRTVRYYIQIGLVPRPVGEGRAAHYLLDHLDRLLQIKRLSGAGVSLGRIREVLGGEPSPVPPRRRRPGHLSVRHHVYVAPGLEVVYSPEETGLGAAELRELTKALVGLARSFGLQADLDEPSGPDEPPRKPPLRAQGPPKSPPSAPGTTKAAPSAPVTTKSSPPSAPVTTKSSPPSAPGTTKTAPSAPGS
jgi:DNA-binding transcriptional MerR regulator